MGLIEPRDSVWSLPTKACLICAVKKQLNNFYPRSMYDSVEIQLRPYLASWLEDYLKMKVEVLLGLASLQENTLDEMPWKELVRDVRILHEILKQIARRGKRFVLGDLYLLEHLDSKERELNKQTESPIFDLKIEQIDQLGQILLNEYKHIKSHDDTYYNNNDKTLDYLQYILHFIEEKALESRDDVCNDCLKLYHPKVHPPGECYVCCIWDWHDTGGMCDEMKVVSTPEEFPGWTDFQFSYEISRVRPRKVHDH
jgi:hypothetical protein